MAGIPHSDAQRDRQITGALEAVHADLPAGAVLLADDWRYAEYYLPQVPIAAYSALAPDDDSDINQTSSGAPPMPPLQHATALAWYEPVLDRSDQAMSQTALMPSRDGTRLRVLRLPPGEHFLLTPTAFGLAPDK